MRRYYDLQLFAEDAEGAETTETVAEEEKKSGFDEFLGASKENQSEFDRRVSKAIETSKAKWKEEEKARVTAARSEAEKLAKMTAEEKLKHEAEKRESELSKREQDLIARELKQGAKDILIQKNLPLEFAELLNYTDAENTKTQLADLEKAFNVAVENRVQERLKGKPPMAGNVGADDELTKQINDAFKNLF